MNNVCVSCAWDAITPGKNASEKYVTVKMGRT